MSSEGSCLNKHFKTERCYHRLNRAKSPQDPLSSSEHTTHPQKAGQVLPSVSQHLPFTVLTSSRCGLERHVTFLPSASTSALESRGDLTPQHKAGHVGATH